MIETFAFALPLHEPFVTVIASVVLPDAPAVKLMAVVPCPLLIVPLVIVHAYVAPACEATLAFALAFAQTFAGAVIVGVGTALIVIDVLPVPLHEPLVTVMPRVTLPDAPAVKLIAFVLCPLLIVPFVIVHAYVAPACDGTLALALPFAQMFAGARIAAAGVALMFIDAFEALVQPFALTVTLSVTLPDAPAVKLIAFVFCPLLIVPFVIDHV